MNTGSSESQLCCFYSSAKRARQNRITNRDSKLTKNLSVVNCLSSSRFRKISLGKAVPKIQIVGISLIKDERDVNANIEGYIKLNVSDDWNIFIPKAILSFKDKNILTVDDFCLAGEFHVRLKNELINLGIPKERIRVSYAVITSVTKSSNRAPDYYWREITDDNFYFPWGKANTG